MLQNILASDNEFYLLLRELAMDLHWSWSHTTDKVWRQLDPVLWDLTHNPLVVLQTVSPEHIKKVMQDQLLRDLVHELIEARRQRLVAPAWFQHHCPGGDLSKVAFFSMEFMLSEALPIYSGGLGNVAGDHLKTASDLGVPLVGVSLLFQQGYSRQVIYANGEQRYVAPYNDPGQLPIEPLRNANGEWIRIEIKLPGYSVWLRCWQAQVGRTNLYLLDSNDVANFPVHRGITNELYASGSEVRLLQELVLGIGGWLMLEELGFSPEVCHLNEGHAAFVVVERALKFMDKNGCSFDEALMVTRAGNVFTTHTAVGAGFDLFSPELLMQYLGDYFQNRLKISAKEFLALGRKDSGDDLEPFNTAYLAFRGSISVNGVSRIHSQVSRHLFSPMFPRWPLAEVPVGYVTNGVHMPTWDSPEADRLWTETCGKERWLGKLEDVEQNMKCISNERIWAMREEARKNFVSHIRQRYSRQLATIGSSLEAIENAKQILDPTILTIGFARRFVSYKRTNLLLNDKERLKQLLLNRKLPVQLVIAGKAHRMDNEGHAYIKEWVNFINSEKLDKIVIFLSDYDMMLCEQLVQGVDLWINTPRKPWEACGTSGMKVLVNGGLNVSVLDGWWDEAYIPEVGWKIDSPNKSDSALTDEDEANQLYQLLESEIVPAFYNRNEAGIPENWVERVRTSMAVLTPQYSANRSLREYTEKVYLPAAKKFANRKRNLIQDGYSVAKRYRLLQQQWRDIRFQGLQVKTNNGQHHFCTQVHLALLSNNDIVVQLYAEGQDGAAEIYPMSYSHELMQEPNLAEYRVSVPAIRSVDDYTPRVIPKDEEFEIPFELNLICWQR